MLTPEAVREAMIQAQRDSAREELLSEPTAGSATEAEDFFAMMEEHPGLIEKCAIRIPTRGPGAINAKLAVCLSTWGRAGAHWDPMMDDQGGFIERTRAKIVYDFLNDPELKRFDFLIMIDDDMEPQLDLLHRLMRWNEPLVGARCMSMHPEYGPIMCYSAKDEAGLYRFPSVRALLRVKRKVPITGKSEVGHIGTGAVAIRRDALESFIWDVDYDKAIAHANSIPPGEWTRDNIREQQMILAPDVPFMVPDYLRMEGFRHGELRCGEDMWFCVQLRRKGYKLYVDNSAEVGHRKSMCLTLDNVFRDPNLDPAKWVLPMEGPIITVE